jgi:hypothetical protein
MEDRNGGLLSFRCALFLLALALLARAGRLSAVCSSNQAGSAATFTCDVAADTIVFDQSGGLLRHDRFSSGDTGFNSDFDFDSTVPGDQTLSASNPSTARHWHSLPLRCRCFSRPGS